ncbi:MAG TPA: triphosphoribosyl-dephospho-CoA synthase [Anaerolineaceae bacterium]|nr:triphosphoribosyl-dephospho-CoA synthase [Anaerolineaceae bacterium]
MSPEKWGNSGLSPGIRIAQAAQIACLLEVSALKPGNVSRPHDFSDLRFEDFLLSAVAIGPAMQSARRNSVGKIIWRAIRDTQRVVNTNTNLGIVLLLSPLVKASNEVFRPNVAPGSHDLGQLKRHLSDILANLSVEDARLAYKAIRQAQAGGLGRSAQADVSEEPTITLLQAMELAKERDSVAREYVSGYHYTFDIAYPALRETYLTTRDLPQAIVQTSITLLASIPDTLIARKRGKEMAIQVSQWASEANEKGGVLTPQGRTALQTLDGNLRDERHTLNPGTTADLTAAAIFLHLVFNHIG